MEKLIIHCRPKNAIIKVMNAGKKNVLIFGLVVFFVSLANGFVFAQRPLEIEYPEMGGVTLETVNVSLPEYVKYVFNFSLGVAGLLVFSVLVYSGFRYLTSVGDPRRQKDAKERILAGFLGFAVLLFSYLILTTINPQLVFLTMPERTVFPEVPIIGTEPGDPKTLYATEIPLGSIMGQIFLESRLLKIKDISESLRGQAEKVKNLSQELKTLTEKCSCSLVDKGRCEEGSCDGNSGCTSFCHCLGEPHENYDPCPNRAAIDQKRQELKSALSEIKEEGGLRYWQVEFEKEVIDLRKLYDNLLAAEQLIKNCSKTVGRTGSPRDLFNYREFLVYRQTLQEDKIIEGTETDKPFGEFILGGPYELATFYCSEIREAFPQIEPEEVPLLEGDVPSKEVFCDEEIPIGETVDNAEELTRLMLAEMGNINSNTLGEIDNAQNLSDLPEDCRGSNCDSSMNPGDSCCESYCCECCPPPPPPEQPPEAPLPEDIYNPIYNMMINPAYAQSDCEFGCCQSCCARTACTSCSCACTGNSCPVGEINRTASGISSNYNKILSSRNKLVDLINEKAEDKLKISSIFKILAYAQGKLAVCYNPKERYSALKLSETTNWEYLYSCSDAGLFLSLKTPLYYRRGQEINECYGPAEGNADFMDNFFCCVSEISL